MCVHRSGHDVSNSYRYNDVGRVIFNLPSCSPNSPYAERSWGRRSPPNLPAWLRKMSSTVESRELLLDKEVIMRNIVVSEFVSLDNIMHAPGGAEEDTEGGFIHGGWTWPIWHQEIVAHFFLALSHNEALPLGRKTTQIPRGAIRP